MVRWSEQALAAVALLLASAAASRAQEQPSFLERLGLDRLQFVSLGASLGRINPSQVESTRIYAISADYGEIARDYRVVFGVSYWESRMRAGVVQAFLDTLRRNIVDPTADDTLRGSTIPIYDVTFSGSVRWQRRGAMAVRPFVGAGAAAHVINAEGKLIKGTFVERALDNIAAGFFAESGVLLRPASRLIVDSSLRADLLSGFRSIQLRAGVMYSFGPARRPQ